MEKLLYKFCPICSGDLVKETVEQDNRPRLVCRQCGFIFYINPIPAVGVILFNDKNEILLIRRKYKPEQGRWSLPAGFMESDETAEQTAVREAKEETNLDVKLNDIFGVFSSFDYPQRQVLVIIYRGEIVSGQLSPGDDAEELRFFSLENLPREIAFSCHQKVLDQLLNERKQD